MASSKEFVSSKKKTKEVQAVNDIEEGSNAQKVVANKKLKEDRLMNLPNIGKILEKQLKEVGINTLEDLKTIGSQQAWLRILKIDESACYNRLCALEGALQGIRWHQLSDEKKAELKAFYTKYKA